MMDCDMCSNFSYDEDLDEWCCEADMDEDDMAMLWNHPHAHCPFWHSADEYRTVKHQSIGHLPGYSDAGHFTAPHTDFDDDYDGEA